VDSGKDFGSSSVRTITAPKVALIGGEGTSSLNFGEIWHHFEQELDYPLSILDQNQVGSADLSRYNVIIMPSGRYAWKEGETKKLQEWIRAGGKVIAIDAALNFFADKEGFGYQNMLAMRRKRLRKRLMNKSPLAKG